MDDDPITILLRIISESGNDPHPELCGLSNPFEDTSNPTLNDWHFFWRTLVSACSMQHIMEKMFDESDPDASQLLFSILPGITSVYEYAKLLLESPFFWDNLCKTLSTKLDDQTRRYILDALENMFGIMNESHALFLLNTGVFTALGCLFLSNFNSKYRFMPSFDRYQPNEKDISLVKMVDHFLWHCKRSKKVRKKFEKIYGKCSLLRKTYKKSQGGATREQRKYWKKLDANKWCDECNVTQKDKKLFACGACFSVYYCSAGCQRKAWNYHKRICKKLNIPSTV